MHGVGVQLGCSAEGGRLVPLSHPCPVEGQDSRVPLHHSHLCAPTLPCWPAGLLNPALSLSQEHGP